MNPVAFSIGGFQIRWYGVIIAVGIVAAFILANINCRKGNYDFDTIVDIFLIAFPFAIIGARVYYVIFQFQDYRGNLADIFNIRLGGLAIHGGLIFGLTAAYIYTRYKNKDFAKIADLLAPSIVLAQAIGRWGNFFNGEAHGGQVSYEFISRFPGFIQRGMHIDGVYYHPTFLYESIWNLLICIVLVYIFRRKHEKGTVIAAYIGLYSLGRFFIEGLRTDSLMIGPIRMAQLVSILGIIFSIVFLIVIRSKKQKPLH
ncbi:MAG: prolipoprotein diacylglyceryl transferase [Clostridium sp.]|jgi:phosphatidylglycerol:prolipoprotein diacylglycerol transferase|uniref:prolipoprotein diacylglyceryl transferase n=1 Tax=Clostridium sp. TaxID=1506 RepID=UPI0025BA7EA7|nr:prolipoprotein diacylglyceryl transferase [Clostridium sp.]MCH3964663.1 prolipoprotein diacylglyceryl transferase [Clostridium sp.]MCI1715134.1 prolipoprotein diacylglyceryl transferase [Clostridium sp.]MCI1799396.1 prolipoprotein diacylglyceryl transferase [Clostridium sp.]MCI1813317.1 prolipoprotein diacylglyceryl transferase [Clostridium sp.]MCI1870208.1 prolipoprotein diacylglyceryl transferase [Clostridium sp.]